MAGGHHAVDLAIVGAGPAGCCAAIAAAQAGARVALLERQRFPRERPGETLHPGIEPLLAQLGARERLLAAGFPRHEGVRVAWGGPPRLQRYGADEDGPWRGFQAWRPTFDALLLARATEAGVDILQPRRAIAPLVDRGRVTGVATQSGRLAAAWLIDAGGRQRWLARALRLRVHAHSPRLLARWGYRPGGDAEPVPIPTLRATGGRWTWSADVGGQRVAWVSLAAAGPGAPPPPDLDRVRTADVSWRVVAPAAGPGFLLAGDAAATLDPAAGQGVLKACLGGMLAAHLATATLAGRIDSTTATAEHARWVTRSFEQDAGVLRALYRRLPRPPAWAAPRGGDPLPPPAAASPW